MIVGSSSSIRRSATTSSPISSAAPLTIALSSAVEVGAVDDRALDVRRGARAAPGGCAASRRARGSARVWASARAIPRSSAASSTLKGSPSRASASQPCRRRSGASTAGTSPRPGTSACVGGGPSRAAGSRRPIVATTTPSRMTAPASASNASAARSTPVLSAHVDALAVAEQRQVLRQLLGGPAVGERGHAEREDDERLVVEAADPARAGDLAVGVEAGDRARRRRAAAIRSTSARMPSSPSTPRRAMQSNASTPSGGWPPSAASASAAGGVGRAQHRVAVALHEPGDRALRHLGDAAERAVLEVGLADEADVVLAAAAAEAERVGEREARERGRVGVRLGGRVEPLEVDVQRGPVVERVDAVARSCAVTSIGSPTRLPAVAGRRCRAGASERDRDADHGVGEDLACRRAGASCEDDQQLDVPDPACGHTPSDRRNKRLLNVRSARVDTRKWCGRRSWRARRVGPAARAVLAALAVRDERRRCGRRPCGSRCAVAARSVRRRASSSSVLSSPAGRRGCSRACQRISSASRLPTPAIAFWSSSRALIGVVPAPDARAERVAGDRRRRPGRRGVKSGSITARPSRRLSRSASRPAVGELQREAVPARSRLLVEHDPAGHPEVQPELRAAVGLRPQELAAPVGLGEPVADQRGWRSRPGACGRLT